MTILIFHGTCPCHRSLEKFQNLIEDFWAMNRDVLFYGQDVNVSIYSMVEDLRDKFNRCHGKRL